MTERLLVFVVFLLSCVALTGCRREGTSDRRDHVPNSAGHQRMLDKLAERMERSLLDDPLFGHNELRDAEQLLSKDYLSDWERFGAAYVAGVAAQRLGQHAQAVEYLNSAYELLQGIPRATQARLPGIEHRTLLQLASACMRLGETENCIACQTSDSCIFPIQGEGIHVNRNGSEMAVACLERLLAEDPDHVTARWLLNLAQMTLGGYPDQVPDQFLISPDRFASEASFPRFVNVAAERNLNAVSLSGGVIVDDFDGDERLDVVVSDWADGGQLLFFHNAGSGKFERRVEEAGLRGLFGGLNLVQADYDNDGDLDILVLRGAWRPLTGSPVNSLLQNDGRGIFQDVTFEAGLAEPAYPSSSAAWSDFDNDGDLDLYVGNEQHPCQLFVNDGRGRFTDRAAEAGVENRLFTKAVAWGDYDQDGYQDLYVSNYGPPIAEDSFGTGGGLLTSQAGQPNRLYHNNRDGTFSDVAVESGVDKPLLSYTSWFWDYNNDGALDLFVSTYDGTVETVARSMFGLPYDAERMHLYEGDGAGGFRDVAQERGLDRMCLTMGANLGDLNNDGYLDFYLGTGHPAYEALMPNRMFLNDRGGQFLDVTTAGGFGHLQKGHGIAFADLDNDGDQDVFAELGGAFPGDTAANALFENPGTGQHWLHIRLSGRESNRCAIGAKLHLQFEENGKSRSIFRWVGSGGSFGANPLRQEIGLGNATRIKSLEITWPGSGRTDQFVDLPVDRLLEIEEGQWGQAFQPP